MLDRRLSDGYIGTAELDELVGLLLPQYVGEGFGIHFTEVQQNLIAACLNLLTSALSK